MSSHRSESGRAIVRIGSNYARLLATVLLGLALMRLLLHSVGSDAVGLIALIGSTVGFTSLLEDIVGSSMIREVGVAYHDKDARQFDRMYNSAVVVSAGAAALTLVIYGVIFAIVPLLQIDASLIVAARWFIIAKAVESASMVLLAPQFNMFLIGERMVAYNIWFVARRAGLALAATLLLWLGPAGPAQGVVWYGWISCGLVVAAMIGAAIVAIIGDPRLLPRPRLATRDGVGIILRISGWNIAILFSKVAMLPVGAIIMNQWFGLHGNFIFGVGVQFAGYARMLTSGMTGGIDAVAARLSSAANTETSGQALKLLLQYSTRLHGLVAFPAAVGMAVLAEPFLEIWIGPALQNNLAAIPEIAVLGRILLLGFVVQCLSDNWLRMLYGAGHINRYARLVTWSGFCTPVLSVVMVLLLPQPDRYTGVAWAVTMVYVIVHFGLIPRIVGATIGVLTAGVYGPLVRPALVAVALSPILVAFEMKIGRWNIWWLAAAALAYGVAYAGLALTVGLTAAERARLWRLAGPLNRFWGRQTAPPGLGTPTDPG